MVVSTALPEMVSSLDGTKLKNYVPIPLPNLLSRIHNKVISKGLNWQKEKRRTHKVGEGCSSSSDNS